MAVIGTFGSYTAARMGIYASQASLNVTGNNIANINTTGYTRQRLDLASLHAAGVSRYQNGFNLDIGYGVLAEGTSQLRDPYLDIRYRDEQASVGYYEATVKGLQQLSYVLDEVGQGQGEFGILEAQFNDFLMQLQNLNNRVGSQEYDTTVRSSAESLVKLFNTYADSLSKVKDNQLKDLQGDVDTVNTILTQIRDLNAEIRNAGIYGDKALELRDSRNVLIDQLSSYIKIDVSYDMEKLDEFTSVERLNISIADSGNPPTKLIQGIYGTQLSMPEMIEARNPDYDPDLPTSKQYIASGSTPDNIMYTNDKNSAMKTEDGNVITNDAAGSVLLAAMDGFADLPEEKMYGALANLPIGNRYIDTNSTADNVIYTNDETAAMVDNDGNPITNDAAGAAQLQALGSDIILDEANMYNKSLANSAGQYLDEDGNPTDDISAAKLIDNAVEGSDSNRLWMRLEPLVDKKGRYMKDQRGRDITDTVELGDNDLFGSIQAKRELLTEEGEFASEDDLKFDPDANIKRGIPYYQLALDALARKFADEFNKANTGVDENGDPNYEPVFLGYATVKGADGIERYDMAANCDLITGGATGSVAEQVVDDIMAELGLTDPLDRDKAIDYLTRIDISDLSEDLQAEVKALQDKHLGEAGHGTEITGGGVLFSNHGDSDDPTNITAANISIANSWAIGDVRILNTKNVNSLEHTTANDNIYHMIELMSEKLTYTPDEITDVLNDPAADGSKTYFEGSFQQRLADINNILATKQQTATIQYNTFEVKALNLDNQRQSVAGVDLNEEATNMMQFQKSYAAACQLMTTLDSMLDKLINDTIR